MMRRKRWCTSARQWLGLATVLLMVGMLAGCAASRSPLSGAYGEGAQKNLGAPQVSVFFLIRHLTQEHGFDAIPKLQRQGVKDFDNLFLDALGEISNISEYVTFTESPDDVNSPKRREELARFRSEHEYTLQVDFFEESSFKQQCLSATVSILSLTLIPVPYTWNYTITASLFDQHNQLVRSYQRRAYLNNWVQTLLLFAYPFYPLEGKREEIYAESLHDLFRQIEADKVLKK